MVLNNHVFRRGWCCASRLQRGKLRSDVCELSCNDLPGVDFHVQIYHNQLVFIGIGVKDLLLHAYIIIYLIHGNHKKMNIFHNTFVLELSFDSILTYGCYCNSKESETQEMNAF